MLKRKYNFSFYSSFIFLINVIIGLTYQTMYSHIYALLFFILFTTSILFRTFEYPFLLYADKLAIYSVVAYGAYMFFTKTFLTHTYFTIILTFLTTIVLYHYGHLTNQFCFSEDKDLGELYHAFMHCVSSLGHLLIMTV